MGGRGGRGGKGGEGKRGEGFCRTNQNMAATALGHQPSEMKLTAAIALKRSCRDSWVETM